MFHSLTLAAIHTNPNMSKDTKWKEHLLKSGIPLEYEIKEFLISNGCISNFEFTYHRENEIQQLTEFSYDIDASWIRPPYFIDLMVECKYRHESTKWLFLPEEYGGIDEISYTDFLHRNDNFNPKKQWDLANFPFQLGPLCSKGIELTSDGPNPKTITQAIAQLSYAMAHKFTNGIYHQVDQILSKQFAGAVFCNIPIIVTTAELFRMKENTSIEAIKGSVEIEEVAIKEKCLIIKNSTGVDLERYNLAYFKKFSDEIGKKNLSSKLNTFSKDLDFFFSVIAKNFCPRCILVVHYSQTENGLADLLSFLGRCVNPDEEVKLAIKRKQDQMNEAFKRIDQKLSDKNGS